MGGGAGIMIGRSRSTEESVDEYTLWQTYITGLVLVFRLDIDCHTNWFIKLQLCTDSCSSNPWSSFRGGSLGRVKPTLAQPIRI